MLFFHDDRHRLHFPQAELDGGQFVTPYERPSRVEYVLRRLQETGMRAAAPGALDMGPVRAVHAPDYLEFLETCWADWVASGARGEIIATSFPVRRMRQKPPRNIDGKVGYYSLAAETAITAGTWEAAQASCALAQSAQRGRSRALAASPGTQTSSPFFIVTRVSLVAASAAAPGNAITPKKAYSSPRTVQ